MSKYVTALTVTLLAWSLSAETTRPCVSDGQYFWEAMRTQPAWHGLAHFRLIEKSCLANEDYRFLYAAYRAELESFAVNHASALAFIDKRGNSHSLSQELPESTQAVSATQYIVKRAKNHRIVVTNERHHASSDRLLPLALLKPLYSQGFRYLAVEGYAYWDSINERGYPIVDAGHYSNDVVYAQMLRSAVELGFEVVGYEIEPSQRAPDDPQNPVNRQHEREMLQAQNIVSRIFEKDPLAKVLIHCGYGHIHEKAQKNWSSMTQILKETIGLDPLTVDQTLLSERSNRREEHPLRQRAAELDLLSSHPLVLLDEKSDLVSVSKTTDVQVIGLQTQYEHGRPSWLNMQGNRKQISFSVPECADRSCILEAANSEEIENAVVYDRVEVSFKDRIILYLPPEFTFDIRIMDLDGRIHTNHTLSTILEP